MKSVVVAMSGGVDSSVAAALLKEQGYQVRGVTMRFDLGAGAGGCSRQAVKDAAAVARQLGIRHETIDFTSLLRSKVIAEFVREYSRGRTPNPCVRCNETVKFAGLLAYISRTKADYLATGHYSRIGKRGNRYFLKKALDPAKDQSYFLYRLKQEQLSRILFPLGGLKKEDVRALAGRIGLPVAQKKDSQEICFIKGSYRDFIASRLKGKIKPGEIVDTAGNVLGRHKGIAFYTIGQRDKLGIACGYPVYVAGFDVRRNRVVVGRKEEVLSKRFLVDDVVYPSGKFAGKALLQVRIRHLSPESPAWVKPLGPGKAEVIFKEPRFAVTPGQSAVFYKGDIVVGGGIISGSRGPCSRSAV